MDDLRILFMEIRNARGDPSPLELLHDHMLESFQYSNIPVLFSHPWKGMPPFLPRIWQHRHYHTTTRSMRPAAMEESGEFTGDIREPIGPNISLDSVEP